MNLTIEADIGPEKTFINASDIKSFDFSIEIPMNDSMTTNTTDDLTIIKVTNFATDLSVTFMNSTNVKTEIN